MGRIGLSRVVGWSSCGEESRRRVYKTNFGRMLVCGHILSVRHACRTRVYHPQLPKVVAALVATQGPARRQALPEPDLAGLLRLPWFRITRGGSIDITSRRFVESWPEERALCCHLPASHHLHHPGASLRLRTAECPPLPPADT